MNKLDKYLKQKLKRERLISTFNSFDVQQILFYAKISCQTYLHKILNGHKWFLPNASHIKSPMTNESGILKTIYTSISSKDDFETFTIQLKMDFCYRQAIGELIFAAVICRLDILFLTILLS